MMSDMELLEACGPSWAAMTSDRRARYGPPLEAAPNLLTIAALIDLVCEFPRAVRSEGLFTVALRWGATQAVVSLATSIDGLGGVTEVTPQKRTLATLPSTARRSLMELPSARTQSLLLAR